MARKNKLKTVMNSELPSILQQKKKLYRPSLREVRELYDLINQNVFDGKLKRPKIVLRRCRGSLGWCIPYANPKRRWCEIILRNRWYCIQWTITILAHEMSHQWEWDSLCKTASHGKHFFIWKKKLERFGIPLKRCYYIDRWFKTQSLLKI